MLLTIDIGNTNITLGVFDNNKIIQSWRLATDEKRTEDEYGEGSISEATKNRYKSLNKEKEKDIFGPKEQQEVLEDVNQLLGEYRLKLQSNSSNAQDVKNQIKELLDTVNDYYTAPESKQQVKEFISNAKKEVSIVEIECATRFTKFDKNAPQEEKVSVEECKNKITALRDEYRNIAEEYAPNKTFSDTRAEAIRDKLNGYFNYLDQVYGAENLAQLKEEINAEIPLTKTSKVESKTKEQSVESGKVSDLKIMFSGLRMTPEFATFIEHYNRLYMTSQASQKTPNSSAVVTFQQMCSKLAGKGYGLDNRQKEVAFRLIEIAKIADTAAVESVKTSGSTKKGPDREKQEKTVALEKRILEMFENGLTEEDIVKVVGDNHKKLVSELSKAAKTMSKS